ncbi:2'-5' RNA ligase family protein [Microbacterium sp. C23T]
MVLYVVVALVAPLAVGVTFSRREWPLHVTLAPNFVLDGSRDEVVRVIADACVDQAPLPVRFSADEMFGRERNIPVRIIESAEIDDLHQRLANALQNQPGFAAAEPAYWRAGYRPHMTRRSGTAVGDPDPAELRYLAIAEMTGSAANVIAALTLP